MKIFRPFSLSGILGLCALIGQASFADQTPYSAKGLGLELHTNMPVSASMGYTGMAKVNKVGAYWPNPSLSAFNNITSFELAFSSGFNHVSDNSSSATLGSSQIPFVALSHQMGFLGHLNLVYANRFQKQYSSASDNGFSSLTLESGTSEWMASWAYPIMPEWSMALAYHRLFGTERSIVKSDFADSSFTDLPGDTLLTRYQGGYPSLSTTYRTKTWSLGARADIPLSMDKRQERHITSLNSSSLPSSSYTTPEMFAIGYSYKWMLHTISLDGSFTLWDTEIDSDINNSYTLGMGWERKGNGGKFDSYISRITQRAGMGFSQHYFHNLLDIYGTTGWSFPLGNRGHMVDLALIAGNRGITSNLDVSDSYMQVMVGLTGVGAWGQSSRRK